MTEVGARAEIVYPTMSDIGGSYESVVSAQKIRFRERRSFIARKNEPRSRPSGYES